MPRGIPNNPRVARVEGSAASVIGATIPAAPPRDVALSVILASFKRDHADLWEQIRLGPTQHGIEQMIEALAR